MAMSVPVMTDMTESTKLNEAARLVEREMQDARLKAVTVNRPLRVRLNCPSSGYIRTVEVLGTTADSASNRCLVSAYPFPGRRSRPDDAAELRRTGPGDPAGCDGDQRDDRVQPDGTAMLVMSGAPQASRPRSASR